MERIVQIIGDGRPGGGTTVVLTLSRMLAARGHEVVIIAQTDSALIREAAAERLEVRGIDFSRRASTVATARLIDHHLRELEATVVHWHGARAGLPSALVARRTGRKSVYTVHGFHFPHKPLILRQLARAAEAFCMARADCTVFVSEGDITLAKRHGLLAFSSVQKIIKNAVAVDSGLVQTQKVYDIAFLGRLHYQKNPLILVDILKAMRPFRPSLCVIGGGELVPELETRLEAEGLREQVTLQGERSRAEALRLAASCRLLLLPSRWEGHPLALIEAMHLGLPVVASDVPGNNEIVAHGETGYLVPVNDAAGYAQQLKLLLSDADLMSRMKREAQRRIDLEYSLELMVEAHVEVYSLEKQQQTGEPIAVSTTCAAP
jgi:glycosyltransferase involved in cell wall biosynthesis